MSAMEISTVSNDGFNIWRVSMLTRASAILTYSEPQRNKAEAVVHKMVKRAIEMEGTVTVSQLPICD